MRVSEVSQRYAKALLAATKAKGTQGKAFAELQVLGQSFTQDQAVKAYFENPTVPSEQKMNAVKAAITGKNLSEEVVSTVLLLTEKNRLSQLADVVVAYQGLMDIEGGVTRGTVRSAQPLADDAKKDIEAKIAKVLNKKIILTYSQDPKLLGGVIAQVDGWTFDDSVETHLKKLNEELNRRAN
jgi:F-type H+-transporting ATPase subunit delta